MKKINDTEYLVKCSKCGYEVKVIYGELPPVDHPLAKAMEEGSIVNMGCVVPLGDNTEIIAFEKKFICKSCFKS